MCVRDLVDHVQAATYHAGVRSWPITRFRLVWGPGFSRGSRSAIAARARRRTAAGRVIPPKARFSFAIRPRRLSTNKARPDGHGLGAHGSGRAAAEARCRVQQLTELSHAGDAVGDDVVESHEHADTLIGQAREEPDLP